VRSVTNHLLQAPTTNFIGISDAWHSFVQQVSQMGEEGLDYTTSDVEMVPVPSMARSMDVDWENTSSVTTPRTVYIIIK